MGMVCGLDLHRRRITFDGLDVESGEEWRCRVWQPDRERFRAAGRHPGADGDVLDLPGEQRRERARGGGELHPVLTP